MASKICVAFVDAQGTKTITDFEPPKTAAQILLLWPGAIALKSAGGRAGYMGDDEVPVGDYDILYPSSFLRHHLSSP